MGKKATSYNSLYCFLLLLIFSSCASLRESPKYEFSSGIFKVTSTGSAAIRAYVDVEEDTLILSTVRDKGRYFNTDTASNIVIAVPEVQHSPVQHVYTFSKSSFDLDVLTIPFKYRPGTSGFPQQLTTTFQGAIYIGARKDIFRLKYRPTPVGDFHKSENHFGYSVGFFSGLGATTMNEWVTQGATPYEYEGVVLLNGVAGIVGINNFTLGLAVGIDHLFDENRNDWIYQHKPWVGLAVGLNLN
ncbi:hypothetical protein SAMN04487941_0789 [Pontibacter akesuensis]|uniref:Uncharacterized protein n=2 Tax=Pontibacter akesuensis TaxID=388950 RepID=A0A1I7G7H7_9BACT|nr:hypothetical protein SAMN04487941_0789 [Pontibacter akesuensis]